MERKTLFFLMLILTMGVVSSYMTVYNPYTAKNDYVNWINSRIKEVLTFDANAGIAMNISSNITFNGTVCPKISMNSSGCLIQQSCSGSRIATC